MKLTLKLLSIFITVIFFTSCSQRLVGTWQVQKYETNIAGEQNVLLRDIGSMTFNSDGTGDKEIEYSILGITKKDTTSFRWIAKEKQLTIYSKNSEFAKTWIRIENNRNSQRLKSTDGKNQIQIIELIK